MSHALKCPNPTCPFLFDPTQVPPGAVLTCPRCGMRFTLGPAAPSAAYAPTPDAFPSPPLPAVTDATPRPAPSADGPPADSPPRSRGAAARRADPAAGGSPLMVALAVLAVVGTACAVGYYLVTQSGGGGPSGSVWEVPDFNFAYDFPGPPWEKEAAPAAARANLFGLRRADGEARAAFAASRFETRDPNPGDLREPIRERVRGLFEDPELTEEPGASWAGRPAVKFTFRGPDKATGATVAGEAFGIGYRGVGYWFLAWAPEKEAAGLVGEFEDLRARFRLLDYRKDWKPAAGSGFEVFAGEAAEYRFVDTERLWKKAPAEPRAQHEKADLYLWAELKPRPKSDARSRAELIAYVLDPTGDDPADAVRRLVRDRYAKEAELFGETKLTELTDDPQGEPPAHTDQPVVPTVRLKVEAVKDANRSKLLVLSGVAAGDKVVGVEARCPWADRGLWERRLVHAAGSLRAGRQ